MQVISSIQQSISGTDGCSVLDVDAGESTNRTVFSFVGHPEAVVSGALNAARVAYNFIDMAKHKGTFGYFSI